MFTSNPFAELSAHVSPVIMQAYVIAMAVLVVAGTLFDIIHKKSAKYFFENWRDAKKRAKQQVGGGEAISIAVQTAVVDVALSGEFCNAKRRVAHLLGMYGFIIYVVATVIMVFAYPTAATPAPASVVTLWYIGALMVCLGGYWFWFFIRVDVAAEGNSPFRFMRADLVYRHARPERNLWSYLGVAAGGGQHLGHRVPGALSYCKHGAVRIDPMVEVLAHVLQAGRGFREESVQGQWFSPEFADADP